MSTPYNAEYKVKQRRFRRLTRTGYYVDMRNLGGKSPSRRDCHRANVRVRKLNGCL